MKIEIDTESSKFKKVIEQNIINSDFIQEQIEEILDSEEIQKVLIEKVKNIIVSDEMNDTIKDLIKNYINDSFDLSDYNEVLDMLTEHIKSIIKSKFDK